RRAAAAKAANTGAPESKPGDTGPKPSPTKEQKDVLAAFDAVIEASKTFSKAYDINAALSAIGDHKAVSDADSQSARRWMFQTLVSAKFPNFVTALNAASTKSGSSSSDFEAAVEDARRFGAQAPPSTGSPTLRGLNDLSDSEKENAGLAAAIHAH